MKNTTTLKQPGAPAVACIDSSTKYVVGLMFDESMSNVALIRKNKPAWQAGLLNGIGGKVEYGETAVGAMMREFREEAGEIVVPEKWKHFCSMSGTNNDGEDFRIEFFYTIGEPHKLTSMEAEHVEVKNAGSVCAGDWKTVGNVPWLVALARDFGRGVHPPSNVMVIYSPSHG